jgi:plasmid stability protein
MPVDPSIKNVPDEVVRRLRRRAKRHHRSLQRDRKQFTAIRTNLSGVGETILPVFWQVSKTG